MKKRKILFCLFVLLAIVGIFFITYREKLRFIGYAWYYAFPQEVYITTSEKLDVDIDTLNMIDPRYEEWLIHPCVRYVPDGICGHKWWMACTPFPKGNNKYEQPLLYYGEQNDTLPPRRWLFAGMIQEPHDKGYNADPNLYYDEVYNRLVCVWKEAYTENTLSRSAYNAIMYRVYDENGFGIIKKLFDNNDSTKVHLTAPTIMEVDGRLLCYATELGEFEGDRNMPHGKSGIAIWGNNYYSADSISFAYNKNVMPNYPNGFDYWHTDFCYDGRRKVYYSVVTDQDALNLLFGYSKDGYNYTYLKKPLLSYKGKGHPRNIYKASMVVVNDIVYVFYPKRSVEGDKVHLYMSSIPVDRLLGE